ncbi:MAG: hypothetical protein MI757_20865, partial [Pirellulales bacterium]|nr:hypothetical protein [Pirellulales bacterium]
MSTIMKNARIKSSTLLREVTQRLQESIQFLNRVIIRGKVAAFVEEAMLFALVLVKLASVSGLFHLLAESPISFRGCRRVGRAYENDRRRYAFSHMVDGR